MDRQLPEVEIVVCEICRKEVPLTEAVMPEVVDYVVQFCGLDCYAKWRQKSGQGGDEKK
ncbi:MAG: DUF3330 domain-containing protein [Gallionella sp.]|jgi:hypothetical protein